MNNPHNKKKKSFKCAHCNGKEGESDSTLCVSCRKFNRCEVCTVIFSRLKRNKREKDRTVYPSLGNPKRCSGCLHFEKNIKHECVNRDSIIETQGSRYFMQHGNFCSRCIKRVNDCLKISQQEEDREKEKEVEEKVRVLLK